MLGTAVSDYTRITGYPNKYTRTRVYPFSYPDIPGLVMHMFPELSIFISCFILLSIVANNFENCGHIDFLVKKPAGTRLTRIDYDECLVVSGDLIIHISCSSLSSSSCSYVRLSQKLLNTQTLLMCA